MSVLNATVTNHVVGEAGVVMIPSIPHFSPNRAHPRNSN